MSQAFNISEKQRGHLERNIWLLPWFTFSGMLMFAQSIVILYFQSKGLTVADFFLMQPLFSILVILLQVPASYLSDRKKRYLLIRCGTVFSLLGTLIVWQGQTFWQLIWYQLMFSMAFSLTSSSKGALLFESLQALGRENEHKKHLGRMRAYGAYGAGVAGVTGGFFYQYHPDIPAILASIACVVTISLSLFLKDAPRKKRKTTVHPLTDIARVVKYTLHGHPNLKWIIFYAAILTTAMLKGFWVIQPQLSDVGTSAFIIGCAGAAYRFLNGLSGQLTHRLEKWISPQSLTLVATLFAGANYLIGSLEFTMWLLPILWLAAIGHGITQIITHDMIQARVASDIRATVISVESMLNRFMFALTTPLFALAINAVNFQFAMICMGSVILVGAFVCYVMMIKGRAFDESTAHPEEHSPV